MKNRASHMKGMIVLLLRITFYEQGLKVIEGGGSRMF
jgi:hypothetical protein